MVYVHTYHGVLTQRMLLSIFRNLQIHGSGFVDRPNLLLCRFGAVDIVKATFASANVVRCSAPERTEPGVVVVAVSVDGGASFGGASRPTLGNFRYFAPCFVADLSPRAGPDTGGTAIAVLGSGFNRAFPFTCSFQRGEENGSYDESGGWAAQTITTPAAVVSASQLTCIAPPASQLGTVPVIISVNLGEGFEPIFTEEEINTTFTYVPGVQLQVLNPGRGPASGGTVVDISGANFAPLVEQVGQAGAALSAADSTVWCKFGSAVTVGFRVANGLVRCPSPPRGLRTAADVEVTVSVNGGADFAGGALGSVLVRDFKVDGFAS